LAEEVLDQRLFRAGIEAEALDMWYEYGLRAYELSHMSQRQRFTHLLQQFEADDNFGVVPPKKQHRLQGGSNTIQYEVWKAIRQHSAQALYEYEPTFICLPQGVYECQGSRRCHQARFGEGHCIQK
jgi:hypothetical protein